VFIDETWASTNMARTHGPRHIFKEGADKHKGRFDKGRDVLREEIFGRQKELGWTPRRYDPDPGSPDDDRLGMVEHVGLASAGARDHKGDKPRRRPTPWTDVPRRAA
jgi:arylsulfatase A-like enzyme